MIDVLIVLVICVISALFAVGHRNIIYGVVSLLCSNVSLGILYYMLGAPTVALFQLAIFAGAIVVFFVITIMFTRGGDMEQGGEEVEV